MDIKKITGVFCVTALMVVVMFFTISRTIHFLQVTLPPSMQALAYPATACFDIGLLGWFFYATLAAEGALQRFTAYLMIFVCFVGVAVTVVADIMISSTANGVQVHMPPEMSTVTLWVVSIIIVINIAAFPLVHIFSPQHLRHFATQQAKDFVIASSHKAILTASQEIAPYVARQVSEQWKRDLVVEMLGYLPDTGAKKVPLSFGKIVDALPSGKKKQESVKTQQTTELLESEEATDDTEDAEIDAKNSEIEQVEDESVRESPSSSNRPVTQKKTVTQRKKRLPSQRNLLGV